MQANPTISQGAVARVFAGVSGLSAFTVAVVSGLAAQNSAGRVLLIALASMLVVHLLAQILGAIVERGIVSHIERYRTRHPVPEPAPAVTTEAKAAARAA
jgi:hypothetical protein